MNNKENIFLLNSENIEKYKNNVTFIEVIKNPIDHFINLSIQHLKENNECKCNLCKWRKNFGLLDDDFLNIIKKNVSTPKWLSTIETYKLNILKDFNNKHFIQKKINNVNYIVIKQEHINNLKYILPKYDYKENVPVETETFFKHMREFIKYNIQFTQKELNNIFSNETIKNIYSNLEVENICKIYSTSLMNPPEIKIYKEKTVKIQKIEKTKEKSIFYPKEIIIDEPKPKLLKEFNKVTEKLKKIEITQKPEKESRINQKPEKESRINQNLEKESIINQQPEKESRINKKSEKESIINQQPEKESRINQNLDKESRIIQNLEKESRINKIPDKESRNNDKSIIIKSNNVKQNELTLKDKLRRLKNVLGKRKIKIGMGRVFKDEKENAREIFMDEIRKIDSDIDLGKMLGKKNKKLDLGKLEEIRENRLVNKKLKKERLKKLEMKRENISDTKLNNVKNKLSGKKIKKSKNLNKIIINRKTIFLNKTEPKEIILEDEVKNEIEVTDREIKIREYDKLRNHMDNLKKMDIENFKLENKFDNPFKRLSYYPKTIGFRMFNKVRPISFSGLQYLIPVN